MEKITLITKHKNPKNNLISINKIKITPKIPKDICLTQTHKIKIIKIKFYPM